MTCMPTSARKQRPGELEDLRRALLGDSFQCCVVAWLLQHHLVDSGYLPALLSVESMRNLKLPLAVAELTEQEQEVALVKAHLAGADPRGSDVRLDSGELMSSKSWPRRPVDCTRWSWRTTWTPKWRVQNDAITLLEALAAHLALLWRMGRRDQIRSRFLHLLDNQAAIAILSKHRSSSRSLNRIARRSAALLLLSGCRRAIIYAETDTNLADAGSRRLYAEEKKS
jgi:hypothetical protein